MLASDPSGVGSQTGCRDDAQQDEHLLDVEDRVAAPRKDDDRVLLLLAAPAPHPLFADRLPRLAAEGHPEGTRESAGDQGQQDMSPYRGLSLLGIPLQVPALLELPKGGVLD